MKKLSFITVSIFATGLTFGQTGTIPFNYTYGATTNLSYTTPAYITIAGAHRPVDQISLRLSQTTFPSSGPTPNAYLTLGRANGSTGGYGNLTWYAGYINPAYAATDAGTTNAFNSSFVVVAAPDRSGITSYAHHTTDWKQNFISRMNRVNSVSYVVNYNGVDKFYVISDGVIYSSGSYISSDRKLKREINTLENSLERVLRLRGVNYKYNAEKLCSTCDESSTVIQLDETTHMGFIAQEVEAIAPEVVRDMPSGVKAVAYQDLTALLVEALKEQNKIVEDLKQRIVALESQKTLNNSNVNIDEQKESILHQNSPNPFNISTAITFEIQKDANEARILIFDSMGKLVKETSVIGKSQLILSGNELAPGTYIYKLIVNGEEVGSKKMVLNK